MTCHIVVMAESANQVFLLGGAMEFLVGNDNSFLYPFVWIIRVSRPSSSLSSECVESLSTGSSYSRILGFPLSSFRLSQYVLWLLGGSWGPLNLVDIELSSIIGHRWSSSSELISTSPSTSLDGACIRCVPGCQSSNTMSRLTWTFRVEGLKHLYPFCSS